MDGAQMDANGAGNFADFNFDIQESQQRIREPAEALHQHYISNGHSLSTDVQSINKAGRYEAISQSARLNQVLGRLHSLTASLEKERTRIDNVISQYTAFLRPIHRLLPELLFRIFLFCVAPESELDDSSRNQARHPLSIRDNPHEMPWALTQVCRSWRNHVLGSPILWSFATIGFPNLPTLHGLVIPEDDVVKPSNHQLRLQLQRASNKPLTVTIYPPEQSRIDRSVYLLCAQVAKWKDVRVKLNDQSAKSISAIRGLLPFMESLNIIWLGCDREVILSEVASVEPVLWISTSGTQ